MARMERVRQVVEQLRRRAAKAKREFEVSVIVGYTVHYAIYVHENLEAFHPVGQAKFLEQPARDMRRELGGIIRVTMKAGRTLAEALLMAGLRLQRESQRLVPVLTGALKNSAFTRLVQGRR